MQFYADADTMVQALKSGELDYAHGVNAEQFKQLQTRPDLSRPWRARPMAGRSSRSTPTGRAPARPSRTAARRRRPCSTRRSATPSATPSTRSSSSSACSAASATSARPTSRRSLSEWHVEPDKPRTFDLELAKQKLDAAGYALDGERQAPRQGRQADQPRLVLPEHGRRLREVRAVRAGVVRRARHRRDPAGLRQRRRWPTSCCRRKATAARPNTTSSSGDGPAARTRTALLEVFRCAAIGTTSDSQYCNPAYDDMYDKQAERGRRRPARDARADAEPDLRRSAVRHPVLRREPRRLPERQVRRLGEHAARRTPMFTYGTLNYTQAARRDGGAAAHARGTVRAGLRGPRTSEAPGPRPRRPARRPATGSGDAASGSGSNTTLLLALVAVVVVVVAGGLIWSRRRSATNVEDE